MGKKIGRNDPCTCGSGKKYKKCCESKSNEIDSSERNMSDFFESYDSIDLIKVIGALQLIPINHGKNIRFEELAQKTVAKIQQNKPNILYTELAKFFANNFQSHYLEDPVTSFFTENVIFFGGNYTVFPGLNGNGTRILNLYIEAIFLRDNDLPKEYKKKTQDAITLILAMSESMAMHAGLERFMFEEDDTEPIKVPPEVYLNRFKEAVTFQKSHLEGIAKHYGIDFNVIEEFIINPSDEKLQDGDPDKNPLLDRPILRNSSEYIFALPSVVVNCLIEFIIRAAEENNCVPALINCYNNHQWNRTRQLAYEMGWKETDIVRNPKFPQNSSNIHETIFQFDNDKLAYVRLIAKSNFNSSFSSKEVLEEPVASSQSVHHDERANEVIDYLEQLNGKGTYKYFTVFITGVNGRDFFFMYGQPKQENQTIGLSFCDFETLALSGGMDGLALWKFTKAYRNGSAVARMFNMGGILDAYVSYKSNNESLLPSDEERPNFMSFTIGNSADFERQVIKDRDEHAALQFTSKGLLPVPVRRLREFAPIYIEREKSKKEHHLLLECFESPIWVKNNQASSEDEKSIVNLMSEAILFWLYKMRTDLGTYVKSFGISPIEFRLELDKRLLTSVPSDQIKNNEGYFISEANDKYVTLKIPFGITELAFKPDNESEKVLMKCVLEGLNQLLINKKHKPVLTTEQIQNLIEQHLQPSTAKMFLIFDSGTDIRLDNRWLVPLREIQESEIEIILDNLVSYLNLPITIPEKIPTIPEKNDLCNKIVATLISKVVEKLKAFNAPDLTKWLIKLYETCIQNREYRELLIPPKIACFSDFPTEVENLIKNEAKLVSTSLSMRCLIEFVAASPEFGSKMPNIDDIDELLALMDQIINWGILSDSIDLGMDDPEMGLLPSGRIGTDKSFVHKYIKPFAQARTENIVHGYIEDFEEKASEKTISPNPEYTDDVKEIDEAFQQEWKISLTNIMNISGALVQIATERGNSIAEVEEEQLKVLLNAKVNKISAEELKAGIEFLTLEKRASLNHAPKGYDKDDIYPWRYNRALSYLRKPLIRIQKEDGVNFYYWGFRHVFAAADHLKFLLFTGRLKAKKKGTLSSYLAKINAEKGDAYRAEVIQWLNNEGSLKTIPFEVTVNENGHLVADKDYGDIDILAIDELNKVIYSIECKNTIIARVMHEMKTEMDKYLGRDGETGMIEKHVERDKWLQANSNQLEKFVTNVNEYRIKSFVLTSEEIPLMYLAKEQLPMPLISFASLKRSGIQIIKKM